MIKTTIVLGIFICFPVFGQTYPTNEFFVGYGASGGINLTNSFTQPDFAVIGTGGGILQVGSPSLTNSAAAFSKHDGGPAGFETSFTHNFNPWFGLKADVSGYFRDQQGLFLSGPTLQFYHANSWSFNALVGPEFRLANHTRFTPFVHGLAGIAHTSADFDTGNNTVGVFHQNATSNGPSIAVGGGLDTRVASRLSVRMGGDYNPTWLGRPFPNQSSMQNNVRLTLGVVFHSAYDRK